MGSVGRTVVEDTGYRMGGFYNNNEIDREEAEIHTRVEKLDNDFKKSVRRNSIGKVLGTNYILDLGGNYKLNISEKTVGKSTIITGSASAPSTQPNISSDTIYRGDFKTVEEAKKKLRAEMKKYLLG